MAHGSSIRLLGFDEVVEETTEIELASPLDWLTTYWEWRWPWGTPKLLPLRKLIQWLRSLYSASWWSQYERGFKNLSFQAKQELLAFHGPLLTPIMSVEEFLHDRTTAERVKVRSIGHGKVSEIVLLDAEHLPVKRRSQPRASQINESAVRIDRVTRQQLNARRMRLGMTWPQYMARLEQLENQP